MVKLIVNRVLIIAVSSLTISCSNHKTEAKGQAKHDTIFLGEKLSKKLNLESDYILYTSDSINFSYYLQEAIYLKKAEDNFLVIARDLSSDKFKLLAKINDSVHLKLVAIKRPVIEEENKDKSTEVSISDTIYSYGKKNLYKTQVVLDNNLSEIDIEQNLTVLQP